MFGSPLKRARESRLAELKTRLAEEHPELKGLVDEFAALDRIARRMHLFDEGQSHAWSIAWWPAVAVVGTFSSGKSSFINTLLGQDVQRTGSQAVDDRFTVLAHAGNGGGRQLPGIALDADPRLPFYRVSERILALEKAAEPGAAASLPADNAVNAYLQMRTVESPLLRHLLLIDSPGFDADASRSTILRLTDHIIELADLVLVFFDARHPEPGAMRETLTHLVGSIRQRHDVDKFMFVLNQIDATAKEDNLDEVVAAWQRAIAQAGMGGRPFYCLYDERLARFDDDEIARRYRARRERDMAEIRRSVNQLRLTRSYRLIAHLEDLARRLESEVVPQLAHRRGLWIRAVLSLDVLMFAAIAALVWASGWVDVDLHPLRVALRGVGTLDAGSDPRILIAVTAAIAGLGIALHYVLRQWLARRLARKLPTVTAQGYNLRAAFLANTRFWLGLARPDLRGWTGRAQRRLQALVQRSSQLVRRLNDLNGQAQKDRAVMPVMEPLPIETERAARGHDMHSPATAPTFESGHER